MRIAIFTSSFPVLSETFVINQIVGLINQGARVDIITNSVNQNNAMHEIVKQYHLMDYVKVIGINKDLSKFKKLIYTIFNFFIICFSFDFFKLFSIVRDDLLHINEKMHLISSLKVKVKGDNHYDKIICHFGYSGYYVCKLREIGVISGRVFTVFHGVEISDYILVKKYKNIYKKLFLEGDMMLPISNLWAEKLISWGCPISKVKVHHMGVDLDEFSFCPKHIDKKLKVVQVGRLTEKKAILDSITAVSLARKRIPIEFSIIGDGDLYLEAKKLIDCLGANEYIYLLGNQPQEIVKKYLNSSNVFLLPSVTASNGDMEGIPVALMEAMSIGLAVISTYHSGIPELIKDGHSGFLVPESSVEQLSEKLVEVFYKDDNSLLEIQLAARSVCESEFNNKILNRIIYSM
ncbi:glycosyltransferase [Vibrio tritonius]|uniref:Glycosyltransferase n=1 Tax=Vibrio tritonius TaxID=1435069 RepID=A0ABS7YRH6_9VIBR|nr:glycosyltransferase [Vibrio tritonius]MCA2017557.1 glycosyltransferase [Vibrio tritonius]